MKAALDALKRIKMPVIEDKPFRNSIITTHLALLKEQRHYEKEAADLEAAMLGAFADDREAIGKLQRELNAEKDVAKKEAIAAKINAYKDLYDAWEAYTRALNKLGAEEVAVPGIPAEQFIAEIQKQDFDLGQIEALYPLFVDENEQK